MKGKLRNRLLFLITEKERRENRRITQTEVARAVNVSKHTIGRWLQHEIRQYDAELVENLCAYFDCDLGDLLYLDPS